MKSCLLRLGIIAFSTLLFVLCASGSGIGYKIYNDTYLIDTIPLFGNLNFYVSNKGADSNDGRSELSPRLSINSIETLIANSAAMGSEISLNLEENSIFREEYNPPSTSEKVTSFGSSTPRKSARISGMDIIKEWAVNATSNNVYQHLLNHSIDLSGPAYNYILIAEIDTAIEKNRPASALKYLNLVPDIVSCNNTPGTYYTPDLTTNPIMIYMHPTEGAPGKNKYRYEVSTRNYNISGYYRDNATYENLFLQSSGNGYGMLAAGKNSLLKNIIFQGGGTHHTVLKSGHIDSCTFIAGPKGLKDRIATVFYSAEGTDANNSITNTIYLNVPNAVYTHTNGEVNHKSLLLDKVYAFADTTDASTGLSANNTDSVVVNDCYVEGYPMGWWYGGGRKLLIKNSIFRKTNQSAIQPISSSNINGEVKVNNVLVVTDGNDKNQNETNGWTAYGVRSPYGNVNVEVSNSIIHGYSTWHANNSAITTFQVSGLLNAHNNIYICDVNENNSMFVARGNNMGGKGTSVNIASDSNVYILLRGSRFYWIAEPNNNNDLNVYSLSEWQSLTGQDKHSIFIDLRNSSLGLKSIFVDPANGNWSLNQSPEANSIRKISAGMTNPPLFYPQRPILENGGSPYKAPSGFSSFGGTMHSEVESVVQWQTFNESQFESFIIEYSLDGKTFLEAGRLKATDDGKSNSYQYLHTHQETDSIYYRLKSLFIDSTNSLSAVIKLTGNFSPEFNINIYPNPFGQEVTVAHPRRKTGEIKIYDYLGRLIKKVSIQPNSSKTVVSLAHLPSGRYFIQWKSDNAMLTRTVVK